MPRYVAGYVAKALVDWTVPQGADTLVSVRPFALTDPADPNSERIYTDWTDGWTARAQIRQEVGGAVWATFTSEATDGPRVELFEDGWIEVILPADTTEDEAWNAYTKPGVWDLEIVYPDGVKVDRMVAGNVFVSHDVTRE